MRIKPVYFIISLTLSFSCAQKHPGQKNNSTNSYSKGFYVEEFTSFKKITVFNPWEKAAGVSFTYYLFQKGQPVPDSLKDEKVIFVPVERVICLSTSHIAFLEVLGETGKVLGVSGSQYVNNPLIRHKLESGEVVDVGYDNNLNYELILQQEPELITVYGVGSEVTVNARKMEDLGLNVFFVAEYLEELPLGKAEWIKCLAPLFEKEQKARTFFSEVEKNYLTLKEKVRGVGNNPGVLVGLPYRDSWWVPGGNSYLARLIADAGGNYLGKGNSSRESYVISFENAITLALDAQVWINTGQIFSKAEIIATDERFADFPAFRKSRIFNNNNRMSPSGGNDFWESGTVCPDRILHDFITIFHPGILEDEELIYYRKVE